MTVGHQQVRANISRDNNRKFLWYLWKPQFKFRLGDVAKSSVRAVSFFGTLHKSIPYL